MATFLWEGNAKCKNKQINLSPRKRSNKTMHCHSTKYQIKMIHCNPAKDQIKTLHCTYLQFSVFEYFWSKVGSGPISEFLINCETFISTVGTIACLSYQQNNSFLGEIQVKRYISKSSSDTLLFSGNLSKKDIFLKALLIRFYSRRNHITFSYVWPILQYLTVLNRCIRPVSYTHLTLPTKA